MAVRKYKNKAGTEEIGYEAQGRSADGQDYRRRYRAEKVSGKRQWAEAKRRAEAFEAQQRSAKATGAPPMLDRTTTVSQYAQKWAETRLHRDSTARRAQVHLKHITGSRLGERPLADVRTSEVEAWVADRSRHLSPGTMRNLYITLKATFRLAVEDRVIERSPCVRDIKLPKVVGRADYKPLTVVDVRRLADAIPERYRAMVITQAGLGLRVGELLALQRRDVDFLRRTVRVERQQSDKGANLSTATKNDKTREIPLPRPVADALAAHLAAHPQPEATGLLFRSRFNNGVRQDYYTIKILRGAMTAAGFTGRTSHDLRHHFVSVLLNRGRSLADVAAMIGDTQAVTLKTYSHMMPKAEDGIRQAIEAEWDEAQHAEETPGDTVTGDGP